jgi:integrase
LRAILQPDADKVTVTGVCEGFLEHCVGRNQRDERMTRKMLVVYRGHVKNHILNPEYGLGSRKLSQLTARSVHEFRDRVRGAGVSVPTARKVLATLHSALEYAISQDWVATNAARGVRVIGPRNEGSERITPPSKEAVRALLDAADEDVRLIVRFAAATGARAGEQWAVRWRDLGLDNGQFNISRRVDAYRDEGAPKSAAGVGTAHRQPESLEVALQVQEAGRSGVPEQPGKAHRTRQLHQAEIPSPRREVGRYRLQLACASALRRVVLDRGPARSENRPDLRGACLIADHHGPLRPSVPE